MLHKPLTVLASAILALSLAGCGASEAPKKPAAKAPDRQGIFISTNDCADAGIISSEMCGKAVDAAVRQHETKTAAYSTIGQCEKAEGKDRCTRASDGKFRARLQAFLITLGTPATGAPLYPGSKKTIGFRGSDKKVVNATDDTLIVSSAAMALAHENSRLP
jgi:hypothetical protein